MRVRRRLSSGTRPASDPTVHHPSHYRWVQGYYCKGTLSPHSRWVEAINWTLSPHSRELLKGRCHHSPGRWVIKVTSSMISKSVGNCSKNCNPPSRLVVCYRDNITIIQVGRYWKGYHRCPDWWVIKGAIVPLSRLVDFKSYSMGHFSLIFMLWVTVGTQTPKSILMGS